MMEAVNRLKIFLPLIILLILSLSVSSASPFIEPQMSNNNGLQIEFPKIQEYKQDTQPTLYFHVFDSNNTLLRVNETTCYIQIFNRTSGKHITLSRVTGDMLTLPCCYTYEMPLNTTYERGTTYYFFWCNSTGEGGFVSGIYEVTSDGLEKDNSPFLLGLIILIPLLMGFLFMKWSEILGEEHNILRLFLSILSITTVFITLWLSVQSLLRYTHFVVLEESLTTLTFIFGLIYFVIIFYFVFYLVKKIFIGISERKNERFDL